MIPNYKAIALKYWRIFKIGMYIIIPIILLLFPADFFDKGTSISLFELANVKEYYSKNITKSVMHLIHFDFQQSWEYNKLGGIVAVLLTYVWIKYFIKDLNKVRVLYFNKRPVFTFQSRHWVWLNINKGKKD